MPIIKGCGTAILIYFLLAILLSVFGINFDDEEDKKVSQGVRPSYQSVNILDYKRMHSDSGCGSKYSEQKQKDIFERDYKGLPFRFRGIVSSSDSHYVAIKFNQKRTRGANVRVKFFDPNAGYDLLEGDPITVEFIMTKAGGCYLSFRGNQGVIIK